MKPCVVLAKELNLGDVIRTFDGAFDRAEAWKARARRSWTG